MSDIGERLRLARQDRDLSTAEVAAATRIKQSYLEALEDGEYSLIPGPAYVSGFLRNYAIFLHLDADDLVQSYHARYQPLLADVKPATRVLASGHERQNRTRLMWGLFSVLLLLGGGYAIKQYDSIYAHPYQAPLITPNNLGGPTPGPVAPKMVAARPVLVRLHSIAPTWVRVTVDGRRVYQGMLLPKMVNKHWLARRTLYVVTYNGANVEAFINGNFRGFLSAQPGMVVHLATPSGFRRVA